MKDNFDACLGHILKAEGGYVDNPHDPGGATNMGITIKTLAGWRKKKVTKADVFNLSRDEAGRIYRARYWDAVCGDDLPHGLDLAAFDAAVNSGPRQAIKWLQQGLGVTPDGQLGPVTLAAAQSTYGPAAIQRMIGFRKAFLRNLSTWDHFGRGWSARLEAVENNAVGMCMRPTLADFAPPDSNNDPEAFGLKWGVKTIFAAMKAAILSKGKL